MVLHTMQVLFLRVAIGQFQKELMSLHLMNMLNGNKDSGGSWQGDGGHFGGYIYSDGTNMRLHNNNILSAQTVRYRYKP